jgi:hypothetical protein
VATCLLNQNTKNISEPRSGGMFVESENKNIPEPPSGEMFVAKVNKESL